jgi:hypothetical protein
MAQNTTQTVTDEWVTFPGGELEGRRPRALCTACRAALNAAARAGAAPADARVSHRTLCFQCYRAELDRERALRAAADLDTASDARFQTQLPFEPVNTARLEMLKVERATSRGVMLQGVGRFVDKRRQAQIAARHALQAIVAGISARRLAPEARERALAFAAHAAELQLPESWLPFVVSH